MLKFIVNASTFVALLFLFVIILISLVIVLGLGLIVGWLLSYLFSFTLFEGSVLALIALGIVGFGWYSLLSTVPAMDEDDYIDEFDDESDSFSYDEIPSSRFYKDQNDKTWEAWFRYQIANSIYIEFQDSPRPIGQMGQKQLQELAVRLADLTVNICKRKPSNTKNFRVTTSSIEREMSKLGQRPYDNDILSLATQAINAELNYDDNIQDIIRSKLWSQPSDMFE